MDRSPPLVLSFSTEMRKPDKLAIRMVIWQAVQSAFAVPLHLLNIMKPCSVALVNSKRIHRLEKTTDKQVRDSQTFLLLNFDTVSQSSARCLAFAHCHWIPVIFYSLRWLLQPIFWWSGHILRCKCDHGRICRQGVNLLVRAPVCVREIMPLIHEAGYEIKVTIRKPLGQ